MIRISILLLSLVSSNIYAGFRVGSGGDVVRCDGFKSKYDHSLFYTLDYLVAFSRDPEIPKLTPRSVSTLNSSLEEIYKVLQGTGIESSIQYFASLVGNFRHRGYRRWWHVTDRPLFDLDDDTIRYRLPRKCYGSDGRLQKYQAIVRYRNTQKIIYDVQKFVFQAMQNPTHFSPMQVSFLYVHEWLWDLTRDVRVVRKLNWLLHSVEFSKLSLEKKKAELLRHGLKFPLPRLYGDKRGQLQTTIYRSFDSDKMFYVKARYKSKSAFDADVLYVLPVVYRKSQYCIDARPQSRIRMTPVKRDSVGFAAYQDANFGTIHKVHETSFHLTVKGSTQALEYVGYPYKEILEIKACR